MSSATTIQAGCSTYPYRGADREHDRGRRRYRRMAAAIKIFLPVPTLGSLSPRPPQYSACRSGAPTRSSVTSFDGLPWSCSPTSAPPSWQSPIWALFCAERSSPRFGSQRSSLSLLVAVIGTTLSAYLYTWQSNQEVEEEIAKGRTRLFGAQGASDEELRHTPAGHSIRDVLLESS